MPNEIVFNQNDLIGSAFALAEKFLSGHLGRRWSHVQGVAERAREAVVLFAEPDRHLLVASALVHDIGYSPALAKTGFHPLDGARFLKSVGAPLRLCGLVAHHSCAYLEAELRGLSGELTEWSDEETSLRDALWWSDMTTSPEGKSTTVGERINEIEERYGPDDLVTFFIRQAKVELEAAVERTDERLRNLNID